MLQKLSGFRSARNIIFGVDALQEITNVVKELKGSRVLILTDQGVMKAGIPGLAKNILVRDGIETEIYDKVQPEPTIESFEECLQFAREGKFNLVVGIGGGSSMDICKLISAMLANPGKVQDYFGVNLLKNQGIPKIAIPTTSGTGSEVTAIGILKDVEQELKIGVVSPYNYPDAAIVDPLLTLKLPPKVTASTGMDALTHAIEAYTSLGASPITDVLAEKAMALIASSLRTAVSNGSDVQARYNMSLGSLLAGIAFANAGVTAVHALSFPLGGAFEVPHGVANTVMLPYVMEYNYVANLNKFARVAELMGEKISQLSAREAAAKSIESVKALAYDIEVPVGLREINVPETAIKQLAEGAATVTRILVNNPRQMSLADITRIFEKAMAN
ncbi:iron-containing alcohol dehydrogenase [Pelotomaculum propionicicum]|uniref:Long-chain-alcohol dehydrogenase 1 n=1 Tax=Pelotomaculum propionicicum TaxID=258475 RepID=A0A4Y7RK45_9FIRM|nr:iron-containing alcohol dehydrogenase [Pelotomaculum propionicicum]TEB09052.1 Long-chain-alcohol dehydrogenase 1 [Pelotomaculum propionicicum]